jgi:toxin ParE1/3/4
VTVGWAADALSDLEHLRAYIAADNPGAAEAMIRRIWSAADSLAEFPRRGRHGDVAGTRELVIPRTPYLIIYRLLGDTVDIVRVMHGAQQWPPL